VAEFHDGRSALEAAGEKSPDAGVSGRRHAGYGRDRKRASRRLRQLPGTTATMLVAVTGWGQDDDRRRTEEAGFDFHLVKPVAVEALRKLLAGGPVRTDGAHMATIAPQLSLGSR